MIMLAVWFTASVPIALVAGKILHVAGGGGATGARRFSPERIG